MIPGDVWEYLNRGYTLLPIEPNGKLPVRRLLPGGQWGDLPGTITSAEEVERWYSSCANLNIAVIRTMT